MLVIKNSKNMFRRIIAIVLIIGLLPLLALISLIIFFRIGENPIFIQERGLTLTKHRFRIYKFKTMTSKKNIFKKAKSFNEADKAKYVFPFGKFLRKSGLDELPQLLNVAKGQMSFIGPRPLDLKDLRTIKIYCNDYYQEREKMNLLPGITGFWQINKTEICSIDNLIKLDRHYSKNKSLGLDFKIFFKTFLRVLTGNHKDSILTESP